MAEIILRTPPLQGELININIFPKGNIDDIRHPKGILEELTAEYNLEKPVFQLENVVGPSHNRRYDIKCTVKDLKHGNTFSAIAKNELRIKLAEHTVARKLLKLLEKTYYFSEENENTNTTSLTYIMCQENPNTLKIKLYKWGNCCEKCYMRGHTKDNCFGKLRNKRLFSNKQPSVNNDEFWNISVPLNLKQLSITNN
ncbi:uncharacterized protein LOC127287195 [Leptopilina boulardi]|uniref:uncharacterized protein LOC127287195 n=1 Tax=Leptopilina boulardi TaxID=63433 RepID=UPI0021F64B65|nr:uncharacterized protein LOC127287195 [Leptopilina boulardi]